MKRLMMIACMAAAAGLVAAEAAPKQHLVAAAYIAPFSEITQTATAVGTMFNQPMMPVMAMAAAQQALAKDYGPIDGAQPVYALVYLDTAKVAALSQPARLEGRSPCSWMRSPTSRIPSRALEARWRISSATSSGSMP